MFRSCVTDEKIKKLQDGLEREHAEWKCSRNSLQLQRAVSTPITYIARPSYRPLENELWQREQLRGPGKDTVSGSNVEHHTAKSLNSLNRAQNSEMGLRLPSGSQQVSSSTDDIVNTEHGFTIQLDAKHFQPRDIQITLYHHTLSVSGDRLEDDGTGAQRLRRSFTRKYTIPPDVRLSSISSYVTNSGYLIIKGSRKGWKETDLTEHLASKLPSNESKISAV